MRKPPILPPAPCRAPRRNCPASPCSARPRRPSRCCAAATAAGFSSRRAATCASRRYCAIGSPASGPPAPRASKSTSTPTAFCSDRCTPRRLAAAATRGCQEISDRPGIWLRSNVQNCLAGEVAIDQATGDGADLVPLCFDCNPGPHFPGPDQSRQQTQPNSRALDAHQLVEQCQAIESCSAGRKELPAFDACGACFGDAEGHAGAVRLQHAERCTERAAADRVEDQPERAVRLGGG